MKKLSRTDIWSLEQYAAERPAFREKVIAHKKNRQVALDEHARLYFEDAMTIRYQVQEMLRIERIFEAAEIEGELESYNPLIPDGSNLKATFMLEYSDENERRVALTKLIGIEDKVWAKVDGFDKVFAIADEDMDRTRGDEKTSSVHFVRFEFTPEMVAAAQSGAALSFGCDHPLAGHSVTVPENIRATLAVDFNL